MITAQDVAKLFLAWTYRDGDFITHLKLQKLIYYAQAWYLVNFKGPLFKDEIEAWDWGPVVRSVYNRWKKHSHNPIPYVPKVKNEEKIGKDEESKFSPKQLKFLNEFFRIYSNLSATALVSMAHDEDPWKEAYKNKTSNVISTKTMQKFYTKKYRELYGKS